MLIPEYTAYLSHPFGHTNISHSAPHMTNLLSTGQLMYVRRNSEALLLNRCCGGKLININFDVLLTVHLSIFISVFNQLDA